MAEEIKFTEEELGNINQLRQSIGQCFAKIGQLSLEKKRRIQKEFLRDYENWQKKEQFKKKLQKYKQQQKDDMRIYNYLRNLFGYD